MGFLIIWAICAGICYAIAKDKGNDIATAVALGFFLGPIGVVIVAMGKSDG